MPEKERPVRAISEVYTTGEQHLLRPKSRPTSLDTQIPIDLDQQDDEIFGAIARDDLSSDIDLDDGHSPEHEAPDPRLRHAFALVGSQTFFAVHIVNWWTEGHNVELILRLEVEDDCRKVGDDCRKVADHIRRWRADRKPIYLVNDEPITIADQVGVWRVGDETTNTFSATVWNVDPDPEDEDWKKCGFSDHGGCVPWDDPATPAALSGVRMRVTDVVRYRHANLNLLGRQYEDYFLFGDPSSDEYHMQHSPTVEPDYDHIVSLTRSGVETDLIELKKKGSEGELATGLMVSIPSIPWRSDCTYKDPPFVDGDEVPVLYHGITRHRAPGDEDMRLPDYTVTVGSQAWFNASAMNFPDDPVPPCGDRT